MMYKGFVIRHALPTGGKAGKGHARTSSITASNYHLMTPDGDNRHLRHRLFRYSLLEIGARAACEERVRAWIDEVVSDAGGQS